MMEGQTALCDGILSPTKTVRKALLCVKSTVPSLVADLEKCRAESEVKIEALKRKLSHEQNKVDNASWGKILSVLATGVLVGISVMSVAKQGG